MAVKVEREDGSWRGGENGQRFHFKCGRTRFASDIERVYEGKLRFGDVVRYVEGGWAEPTLAAEVLKTGLPVWTSTNYTMC